MTPEEAIKRIRDNLGKLIAPYSDEMDAFGMAIEAIEKQIPKKPIPEKDGIRNCPCCNDDFNVNEFEMTYCWECGQRLKWEDE